MLRCRGPVSRMGTRGLFRLSRVKPRLTFRGSASFVITCGFPAECQPSPVRWMLSACYLWAGWASAWRLAQLQPRPGAVPRG